MFLLYWGGPQTSNDLANTQYSLYELYAMGVVTLDELNNHETGEDGIFTGIRYIFFWAYL